MGKTKPGILWNDRKRIVFFGLPWSFTRYSVSKERLFVSTGFFSVKDDEVRLYRVMDISSSRSLGQRIFGLGTIKICSADKTMGDFNLKNIKRPLETMELISDLVEQQRELKRVVNRENMIDEHDMMSHEFNTDTYGDPMGGEQSQGGYMMDDDEDDAPFDRN